MKKSFSNPVNSNAFATLFALRLLKLLWDSHTLFKKTGDEKPAKAEKLRHEKWDVFFYKRKSRKCIFDNCYILKWISYTSN